MSWTNDPGQAPRIKVWWLVMIAFLLVIVLPLGLWLGGVFASPLVGKADAYKAKHGAENWTQAQAGFERDFASVKKLDQQTEDAKDDLDAFVKAHPDIGNGSVYDPLAEQLANLSRDHRGVRQQCQNAVANYNAEARVYTLRDFRSADLPSAIDESTITADLDCK
jgi:hypothetical protein